MEELIELDKTFNEAMFLSKVDNIYIMILSSFMNRNIDKVRHFLGEDLEKRYESLVKSYNDRGVIPIYETLNVKTSRIENVQITDDKYIIEVELISRYNDYLIDAETKEEVTDSSNDRREVYNHLTFEKLRNAKTQSVARSCPNCGHNISVNTDGKCSYCGTIYNQEDFDWVLIDLN